MFRWLKTLFVGSEDYRRDVAATEEVTTQFPVTVRGQQDKPREVASNGNLLPPRGEGGRFIKVNQ